MRKPDFIIGDLKDPYLLRWWIIPRNRFFNIYLHKVLRSDDDRALHDHPWWNVSIILKGGYYEHKIYPNGSYGVAWRKPGQIIVRKPKQAHRLQLENEWSWLGGGLVPCWSLFITGPRVREWGFLCAKGWTHWRKFTGTEEGKEQTPGSIGPGCE